MLQRVSQARVDIAGQTAGQIGPGLLVFLCAERDDSVAQADKLLTRLLSYRVFGDEQGRMNRSLTDIRGGLLLVPQFTLAADTNAGTRPSFTPAAPPEKGRQLFDHFVQQARQRHADVATGQFGADMQVTLTNDGPVTFWLRTAAPAPSRQHD